MFSTFAVRACATSGLLAVALPAAAVTLTFQELPEGTSVSNFYAQNPDGSGEPWGVSFFGLGRVEAVGDTVLPPVEEGLPFTPKALHYGSLVIMSVAQGFTGTLSFAYANPLRPTTVAIYDGLRGQGALLKAVMLAPTLPAQASLNDPNLSHPVFAQAQLSFNGVARSVRWSSGDGHIDDVTFLAAVPEPATWGLALSGLVALFAAPGCCRRKAA